MVLRRMQPVEDDPNSFDAPGYEAFYQAPERIDWEFSRDTRRIRRSWRPSRRQCNWAVRVLAAQKMQQVTSIDDQADIAMDNAVYWAGMARAAAARSSNPARFSGQVTQLKRHTRHMNTQIRLHHKKHLRLV